MPKLHLEIYQLFEHRTKQSNNFVCTNIPTPADPFGALT